MRELSTPPGISMTSAQCIRGWDSSFCHFVQFRFVETHLFMLADSIFKILLTFPENLLLMPSMLSKLTFSGTLLHPCFFQGPSFIPAYSTERCVGNGSPCLYRAGLVRTFISPLEILVEYWNDINRKRWQGLY